MIETVLHGFFIGIGAFTALLGYGIAVFVFIYLVYWFVEGRKR